MNFAVATNSGVARTSTLTIAGQTFTITQAANASCTYALTPTNCSFDQSGGSGNVNVTAAAGCTWTASSNAAWISLQTGSESGTGNGSFGYAGAVNTSSAARSGTITVGGQTFTSTQSGAGAAACVDVAISSSPLASAGSTLTVPITVSDVTGKGALSFDATITFDPTILRLQNTPIDRIGTLSSAMTVTANATTGRLRLSAFGTAALSGSGTLLKLTFNVIGAGTTTNLTWQKFVLNEDSLSPASLTNGNVVVPPAATSVSGATYLGPELAAESIVSAFGVELATGEMGATLPLPTTLAGTTVRIKDSAGGERLAPLFYVGPFQVNYLLPIGTAPGLATVTITNGVGKVSAGTVTIIPVVPGLFTANQDGAGVPAGFAIRVKPSGEQVRESLSRLEGNKQVPAPIDLGPEGEVLILELYGTGIRGRSSQAAVSATIDGVAAGIEYADRQPGFVGLDQVNLRVPRSLLGRGEVDLVLTVEGKAANTVRISIK